MSGPRLIKTLLTTSHKHKGGVLRVINALPFTPRRVFWIYAPQQSCRGGHAHRTNWQLIMAMSGTIEVRCEWRSSSKRRVKTLPLHPGAALVVPPFVWMELKFIDDGVCTVLASEPYSVAEYITDRAELRRLS